MNQIGVAVNGKPDEKCFSNDVIFRHKAPKTRVKGIMPVITHHEIIVLLEGILSYYFAIDG